MEENEIRTVILTNHRHSKIVELTYCRKQKPVPFVSKKREGKFNKFLEIAKKHFCNTYSSPHDQNKHGNVYICQKKSTIFSHWFWNPLKTSVTCCYVFKVIEAKLGLREKWGIQCNWRNPIAMLHRFSKRSTFPPGINLAFIMKLNKHFF